MHKYERDKLKKEKADVLLLNHQMSLAVQQQTEEKVSSKQSEYIRSTYHCSSGQSSCPWKLALSGLMGPYYLLFEFSYDYVSTIFVTMVQQPCLISFINLYVHD